MNGAPDDWAYLARMQAAGRRRSPVLRMTFLALVFAAVAAVIFIPGVPDQIRGAVRDGEALMAELEKREEPRGPEDVPAEAYVPERAAFATRGGANVRDYPLLSGDLIVNLPERTPLNITGRANIQGQWWFRVVLDDGRVGFVRGDVIRWGAASAPAPQAGRYNVDAVEPALAAVTGRAGARIRTGPSTRATQIVRLPAGDEVSVTGRLRQGDHWWLRVQMQDGRTGFARDDVLRTPDGAALDLPA
jgi:hypothetical protein